jgi:hypothetical protein
VATTTVIDVERSTEDFGDKIVKLPNSRLTKPKRATVK